MQSYHQHQTNEGTINTSPMTVDSAAEESTGVANSGQIDYVSIPNPAVGRSMDNGEQHQQQEMTMNRYYFF